MNRMNGGSRLQTLDDERKLDSVIKTGFHGDTRHPPLEVGVCEGELEGADHDSQDNLC